MKRILVALLLVVVLMTTVVSAFAISETWTINPSGGGQWKKCPGSHTMPDSGSFWRATYVSGASSWGSARAYVYKSGVNRATPIYAFDKGAERRALDYLANMKVVGDLYWLVAENPNGQIVSWDFFF